ncbi:MAG: Arylsulfotransferase [Anaerocolumna sp.]|nr:Arylsulfotransferase [Anaerocolumna sp.]
MKRMKVILVWSAIALIAVLIFGLYYGFDQKKESSDFKESDQLLHPAVTTNSNILNSIETTLSMEDSMPVKTLKQDEQLQKELESDKYSLTNPLVVVDPYHNSPLTALALFTTEKSLAVRVTVKGNTPNCDVIGVVEAGTRHRVPIIGLYPDRENTVIIELMDDQGKVVDSNTIMVETDTLPSSMKDMVDPVSVTAESAYGLIEVSGQGTPYPFAFDSNGDIRWYLTIETDGYGMFPLSDKRFIVFSDDAYVQTISKPFASQMYEMDHLGRVYQIYFAVNGVHHDVSEMTPGGNLLILSSSNDDHIEDMVQEIDRKTGEIVKSLVLTDIFGDTYVDMEDWAHLNTVSYNEESDTVLLSPRNIHSGIKVNWSTNELIWILGDPRFWAGTPFEDKVLSGIGDIIWHYQPHSIYEVKEDLDNNPDTMHVIMFDNHWHKTRKVDYFDDNPDSFVTIYTINEKDMTVTQPHIYAGVKSKITSNSIIEYDAGRVFFMGGYLDPVIDNKNGMIYEYDYETEKILNQYALKDTFYRAYELTVDYNVCAKPLETSSNYLKGVLNSPVLTKNKLKVPDETLNKGINLSLKDVILYLNTTDHAVSQIELIGEKNSYIVDYKGDGEGDSSYKKLVYNRLIPISNLEADTYQIVVNYKGDRYNTEESITIK